MIATSSVCTPSSLAIFSATEASGISTGAEPPASSASPAPRIHLSTPFCLYYTSFCSGPLQVAPPPIQHHFFCNCQILKITNPRQSLLPGQNLQALYQLPILFVLQVHRALLSRSTKILGTPAAERACLLRQPGLKQIIF